MSASQESVATAVSRKILITGDQGSDFNIYLQSDEENPPLDAPPTIVRETVGGAGLAHAILQETACLLAADPCSPKATALEIGFRRGADQDAFPTVAVWGHQPLGSLAKSPSEAKDLVWRANHSRSLGKVNSTVDRKSVELPADCGPDFGPDVVLLEDNAAGFRHRKAAFAEADWLKKDGHPWIVLKTSAPVCKGELWWSLGEFPAADRLIMVVQIKHLRQEPIRVSQGISWERTAMELARELQYNPALSGLRSAAHVIVTLHGEGALWMRRGAEGTPPEFTLIFDPAHMEEEWWASLDAKGGSYGFNTTFCASLALSLALETEPADGLCTGIRRGLSAMRCLRVLGHGPVKGTGPGFPAKEIAEVILTGKLPVPPVKAGEIECSKKEQPRAFLAASVMGEFGTVSIPADPANGKVETWRIVETGDHRPSDEPLYGLARRVALLGERALRNAPHARFGKLLTADRQEIEALRNLKRLMVQYKDDTSQKNPLSLAVFGAPGAGKSFGVKEIAKEVLGKSVAILEFNLSQFNDADLAGAFHQVRDKVLEGNLPVVFWDEFDSEQYKWLRHMLAPMQDGKFQEGQITHPIGRCIFVFAGGTSCDMAHFGPPEPVEADASHDEREVWESFQQLKGPDFKSRVHGFLNVLGPNRRPVFAPDKNGCVRWSEDKDDVCFPLRRALLLRAILGVEKEKRLRIDQGLLAAMLETSKFKNGARSFERICVSLKAGREPYRRSGLPSDEVLEMNVADMVEFKGLIEREREFQALAPDLAPAIHKFFLPFAEQNNANRVPFEQLSAEIRGDNHAAAIRISWLLQLVGLYIVRPPVKDALTKQQVLEILSEPHNLEFLSEEEHDLWRENKEANGWRYGKRDNAKKTHDCLVKYGDLVKEQKDKDRNSVRTIPEHVENAGFCIVARKP